MPSLAINKQAKRDYEPLEEYEGGLVLSGAEVKAAKQGQIQLKGSFLAIQNGELWLKNAYIAPYKPAGAGEEYDPNQDRKVLVHKKELKRLIGKSEEKGLTIVPFSVYTRGSLIKLKFAVAKGKKEFEKRETVKKRDIERAMREQMKGNRQADF